MKTKSFAKINLNPIAITILVILIGVFQGLYAFEYIGSGLYAASILFAFLFSASIKIADQWEKAVVLRMGKFKGLKGPGIFMLIPIIDKIDSFIDQRVRVTDFKAEQTLTKDTVPVNVDAVVYWTVWDVEKAALEVQEYVKAIAYIAQTGLRDIIGKHELAELLQERDKIAADLQRVLDENTNPWG
ncbi:MAG: slipin family protein, partial [Bacteroidales bacterium]|nr:slipin family protein [Bacteroidales bacterium]